MASLGPLKVPEILFCVTVAHEDTTASGVCQTSGRWTANCSADNEDSCMSFLHVTLCANQGLWAMYRQAGH